MQKRTNGSLPAFVIALALSVSFAAGWYAAQLYRVTHPPAFTLGDFGCGDQER